MKVGPTFTGAPRLRCNTPVILLAETCPAMARARGRAARAPMCATLWGCPGPYVWHAINAVRLGRH